MGETLKAVLDVRSATSVMPAASAITAHLVNHQSTLFWRNPGVRDQQLRQIVQALPVRCRNARAGLLLRVARLTTDEARSASIVQLE